MTSSFQRNREAFLSRVPADSVERAEIALGHLHTATTNIQLQSSGEVVSLSEILEEHLGRADPSNEAEQHMMVHADWAGDLAAQLELSIAAATYLSTESECPLSPAEIVGIWNRRYLSRLWKVITEEPTLIYVQDPRTSFETPSEQTVYTAPSIDPASANGCVMPENLVRILNMSEGRHRYRIHGANYARCPSIFAIQLYAATKMGVYLSAIADELPQVIARSCKTLLDTIILSDSLVSSGMRMGALMDTQGAFLQETNSLRATRQMHDEKTVVIPYMDLTNSEEAH